jgi:hypothetical protein
MSTAPPVLQPIDRIERLETAVFGSASEYPYPPPAGSSEPIGFTGTATIAQPIIADVPSTVGLSAGQIVTGPGIPADASIVATTANTVTLSEAAASSSEPGATFTATAPPPAKSVQAAEQNQGRLRPRLRGDR